MASQPIPTSVKDWRAGFGVVDPAQMEVITYSLWERQVYTSAVTVNINFFTGGATTAINGNLPLSGQLPANNYFLIQAIRIAVMADTHRTDDTAAAPGNTQTPLEDVSRIVNNTTVELRIGDKRYGRWPTFMLPGGGGATGNLQLSALPTATQFMESGYALNGLPDPRAVYSLGVPVVIPEQYNFSVDFAGAAQTLFGGNPAIFCILDGELMRPAQ